MSCRRRSWPDCRPTTARCYLRRATHAAHALRRQAQLTLSRPAPIERAPPNTVVTTRSRLAVLTLTRRGHRPRGHSLAAAPATASTGAHASSATSHGAHPVSAQAPSLASAVGAPMPLAPPRDASLDAPPIPAPTPAHQIAPSTNPLPPRNLTMRPSRPRPTAPCHGPATSNSELKSRPLRICSTARTSWSPCPSKRGTTPLN